MESLLLQGGSKKDLEILALLAKKIGLKTRQLTEEELEDISLANAMKEGHTGEYINTHAYIKKLGGK